MAYAQPLNAAISVTPRLRTYFNHGRHTSIKHLTTPFDSALVSVPGEEVLVVETRDASFKTDAFRYGHPVVIEPRSVLTLKKFLNDVDDSKVVRMVGNPREVQVEKLDPTDDLHQEARDEQGGQAFTA